MNTFKVLIIILITGMTGCVKWHSGLQPIRPAPGYIVQPTINTLSPELVWKPFEFSESSGISNVTYTLFIYEAGLDKKPETVYERRNLQNTVHKVEIQLASNRIHGWRVRPEYEKKGEHKEGKWNSYSFIGPVWGFGVAYSFRTPSTNATHGTEK